MVDDVGEDGVTVYASGPARGLRPVARALVEAWETWPDFRDMITEGTKIQKVVSAEQNL